MVLLPVMEQTGDEFTVKVRWHALAHPLLSTICNVYWPAALMGPVHCAFPVNPFGPLQTYCVMPAGPQNSLVWPAQIVSLPVMVQTGGALTVNVALQLVWHPFASVIVTV